MIFFEKKFINFDAYFSEGFVVNKTNEGKLVYCGLMLKMLFHEF